jgi:hypothetical protein
MRKTLLVQQLDHALRTRKFAPPAIAKKMYGGWPIEKLWELLGLVKLMMLKRMKNIM